MKIRFLLLTLAFLPASVELAEAQRIAPLEVGDRVRITAPALPATLFGRVVSRDRNADALVLATPGDDARVTVPLAGVQRIDVSEGRRRLAGAAVGTAVGFVAGAAYGAREVGDDPSGLATFPAMLAGGFAGATFGVVIGFAYAPERWHMGFRGDALDAPVNVALRAGARVRRFANGTVAVKGERDRKRGIIRGAVILGSIGLVFGGIDASRGEIRGGEYVGTIIGNTVIGGALGYLVSPRGWQRLPAPTR